MERFSACPKGALVGRHVRRDHRSSNHLDLPRHVSAMGGHMVSSASNAVRLPRLGVFQGQAWPLASSMCCPGNEGKSVSTAVPSLVKGQSPDLRHFSSATPSRPWALAHASLMMQAPSTVLANDPVEITQLRSNDRSTRIGPLPLAQDKHAAQDGTTWFEASIRSTPPPSQNGDLS